MVFRGGHVIKIKTLTYLNIMILFFHPSDYYVEEFLFFKVGV